MKKIIITLVVIAVIVVGWYLLAGKGPDSPSDVITTTPSSTIPLEDSSSTGELKEETVIGRSVEGRDIIAYRYGTGENKVLFVGGIHGGYEWNTVLVGYELIDYLKANPDAVPENVQVLVVPSANPDGLAKVTDSDGRFAASDVNPSKDVQISGRFNANEVDLNRNFDCQWKSTGKWQSTTVSGGATVFSEPESIALKNFIESENPDAAVIWYSAAGGVYSASCGGAVSAETAALTSLYAKASGYPAYTSYDYYETSGDMANWLAKKGVPTISVLLTDHTNTEWTKNKAGIEAVLGQYGE